MNITKILITALQVCSLIFMTIAYVNGEMEGFFFSAATYGFSFVTFTLLFSVIKDFIKK